jgi:hypothetical protein
MTQPALDFTSVYADHRAEVVAEEKRTTATMWRLLAYLERHGSATNVELAEKFGLRFSGRISDLRCKHGYIIDSDPIRGGLWRYTLKGGPR